MPLKGRHLGVVPDELDQQLNEAAAKLCTTRTDIVIRALTAFLPTVEELRPPMHSGAATLPRDYYRPAARVYRALLELDGGPVPTAELAAFVGRHRGNVDRCLTRLRSDGYVTRTARGHRIVAAQDFEHRRQQGADLQR